MRVTMPRAPQPVLRHPAGGAGAMEDADNRRPSLRPSSAAGRNRCRRTTARARRAGLTATRPRRRQPRTTAPAATERTARTMRSMRQRCRPRQWRERSSCQPLPRGFDVGPRRPSTSTTSWYSTTSRNPPTGDVDRGAWPGIGATSATRRSRRVYRRSDRRHERRPGHGAVVVGLVRVRPDTGRRTVPLVRDGAAWASCHARTQGARIAALLGATEDAAARPTGRSNGSRLHSDSSSQAETNV